MRLRRRLFRYSGIVSSDIPEQFLPILRNSLFLYSGTVTAESELHVRRNLNRHWDIAGLHPQNPRHFEWQPPERVSQTLWSSYLSHRNALIYSHTTSRILPNCDVSLGPLTLPAPEAGDFVELILPFQLNRNWEATEPAWTQRQRRENPPLCRNRNTDLPAMYWPLPRSVM